MQKRKIKLCAAVVAGAVGATAGPVGAAAAVAASQLLVDGGYYAADVIFDRHPEPATLEHQGEEETQASHASRPGTLQVVS